MDTLAVSVSYQQPGQVSPSLLPFPFLLVNGYILAGRYVLKILLYSCKQDQEVHGCESGKSLNVNSNNGPSQGIQQ